jgi:large subunit ribosomal protein L2
LIDFTRNWSGNIALCIHLNKDSNRTCFVSLIKYSNGTYSYILAANSLKPGNFVFTTLRPQLFSYKYRVGCNIMLKYSHYTHIFFNLQINLNKYGQYARSAGTFCKIISVNWTKNSARIILPTGLVRIISIFCTGTLGRASNMYHNREFLVKAGFNRNRGVRPSVRGVAMNPVDHPHGGRTKTNSPEVTPWGKIAKFNK